MFIEYVLSTLTALFLWLAFLVGCAKLQQYIQSRNDNDDSCKDDDNDKPLPPNTLFVVDPNKDLYDMVHFENKGKYRRPELYNAFDRVHRLIDKIDEIDDNETIHVLLYSNGGNDAAVDLLARRLLIRRGKFIAYVSRRCVSAASQLALCADEIVFLDRSCVLHKIDTTSSDDKTPLSKKEREHARNDMLKFVNDWMFCRLKSPSKRKRLQEMVIREFHDSPHTHNCLNATLEQCQQWGLPVRLATDEERELYFDAIDSHFVYYYQ